MNPDRMQGSVRNLAGTAQSAVGELAGDAEMQTNGMVDQVLGTAQNAYGRAKDTARDALDRAPEAWNQAVGSGQDYARRGASVVREGMNDQPLAGLLIAAAIGYLIGWAIHGRS